MRTRPEDLQSVLVTDCGSTTTKALLFEKHPDRWRQTFRGEAPTTVEDPVADVTVGAINSFREVEELSNRRILKGVKEAEGSSPFLLTTDDPTQGIDLYLSTSSAGGGLQMLVAGAAKKITTDSAERAALGAGAIVMEAISTEDPRPEHERIERIRELRPDIVLLTGGVDKGAVSHVVEMAETLVAASPRPRFGETLSLPIVFAGNKDAAHDVVQLLKDKAQVVVVDNVRPTLDRENLAPAREAIHEFFLSHVMSHSPGYGKLLSWTPVPIMPTPAAVGDMVQQFANEFKLNVLAVDIGGATTDVFSVFQVDSSPNKNQPSLFNRTVSANLGMSYSVANVLVEAGAQNIKRWLPYEISDAEVSDRLRNKMIRPTSIPQTLEDLWLEQAACREALRLSLKHHIALAAGSVSGSVKEKGISEIFSANVKEEVVDRKRLDMVIGSGGVLSHAPNRVTAALMMLDGFELEGVTELSVDSIFMMPHLGVLASVDPQAAQEIFLGDCLVHMGYSAVAIFPNKTARGTVLAQVTLNERPLGEIKAGHITIVTCGENGELTIIPQSRKISCGAGPGAKVSKKVKAGGIGILLDGRNRPIAPATGCSWLEMQRDTWRTLEIGQV